METIIDLFERSCELFPGRPYLWEKVDGRYVSTSYAGTKGEVTRFAGALLSLGLRKGDRVALLGEGCNKWIYAELGMLYAGGVNVPLSIKLADNEIVFRVEHSGARFLVVSANFLGRVRGVASRLPGVEKIIVFNFNEPEGRYLSFEALMAAGETWLLAHAGALQERTGATVGDDLVNISYTSGTTAEPKGIMLSHKNYVSNVLQSDSLIRITPDYKILLFLPWDHSFAHTVGIYSFMYNGASIASVDFGRSGMEYLRNIPVNLKEVRPTLLLSVPALAKSFKRNIEAGVEAKGRLAWWFYRWGLSVAYLYNGLGDPAGKGPRGLLKPLVWLWDKVLFSKIREVFGGELKFFIGGGALLELELQRYYAALGIPMYQGYGLSEASPVISSNTPGSHRYGSSGRVVKPLDIEIRDEEGKSAGVGEKGEIWVRGSNVMVGYWRNEKNTAGALVGGWLRTGDLGYLDPRGWLYVLGRSKSLLIGNDGEKYSPEGIEEAIVEHSPYIDSCVLYNNQSPYTVALLVPNMQALSAAVSPHHQDAPRVMLHKIQEELGHYRGGGRWGHLFPDRWLPVTVALLPEAFSEANGLVNSSMKVVRGKVTERFRAELEYLYTPEGKNMDNERNLHTLKSLMK
ncbi:MAG: AMP-binding protein [Odoribacteraceae bacterium]|jgi:long-chain acyl-CoA synthetase|nr:AMP-binding protein [Odoribacteraceae bacterium]